MRQKKCETPEIRDAGMFVPSRFLEKTQFLRIDIPEGDVLPVRSVYDRNRYLQYRIKRIALETRAVACWPRSHFSLC